MSGSDACSTLPAAKLDYEPHGEYVEIEGFKTYRTGSQDATKAVVMIYDVFGLSQQTLQGADILAEIASNKKEFQVFVPDFLRGSWAQKDWMGPNVSEEKQAEKAKWFAEVAQPGPTIAVTPKVVAGISQKYPAIKSIGAIGLCWGAKVVSLTAGADTPWKAGAEVHPSRVAADDAKTITIPICMLPSKDENAEETQKFMQNLKTESYFETFADQIHGWMGARANLKDPRAKAEYERGYSIVLDFFKKHV